MLVKPQFELPDQQAEGARARTWRALRREAVDKVREPVARGSGFTVVDRLRLAGRGRSRARSRCSRSCASTGRPDEHAAAAVSATRRRAARRRHGRDAPDTLRWFAIVAPGLEEAARARGRGAARRVGHRRRARAASGGPGPPASGSARQPVARASRRACWRASATSRRASSASCAGAPRGCPGVGSSLAARRSRRAPAPRRCRLYHTGRAGGGGRARDRRCGARRARVRARRGGRRSRCSCAASGSLHVQRRRVGRAAAPARRARRDRRGAAARDAGGRAAGAGWLAPGTALCDPMCGAGTIVIEAAMQSRWARARGRSARSRSKAGRCWRSPRSRARWPSCATEAEAGAGARLRRAGAPIVASDRDPRTIESARRNAERGGVAAQVTFACRDAAAARPPAPTGLVITNPPYGHRLGDARAAARGYRDLGGVLRAHFRGWRAADRRARAAGRRARDGPALSETIRPAQRRAPHRPARRDADLSGGEPSRRRGVAPAPGAPPSRRTAIGSRSRTSPPRLPRTPKRES